MKKNMVVIGLLALIGILFAACSNDKKSTETASGLHKIVIGSVGSDVDVWEFIAQSEAAKKAGLAIEVKEIGDSVTLNLSTADGQLDVNAFQSWAYLQSFNKERGNKLVAIATTYLEPMGIFSKKYKQLSQLPDGATIVLPNDPANLARGLKLLDDAKLIQLKPDFDVAAGTVDDIIQNDKNFEFKLLKREHGARVLDEVDASLISNTVALEAGLNVLKDALYYEKIDQRNKANINVLATTVERKDDPQLAKLSGLYHSDAVRQFIEEHFGGTKVDVDQPLSYLEEQQ